VSDQEREEATGRVRLDAEWLFEGKAFEGRFRQDDEDGGTTVKDAVVLRFGDHTKGEKGRLRKLGTVWIFKRERLSIAPIGASGKAGDLDR
jgi:hypothetical protein